MRSGTNDYMYNVFVKSKHTHKQTNKHTNTYMYMYNHINAAMMTGTYTEFAYTCKRAWYMYSVNTTYMYMYIGTHQHSITLHEHIHVYVHVHVYDCILRWRMGGWVKHERCLKSTSADSDALMSKASVVQAKLSPRLLHGCRSAQQYVHVYIHVCSVTPSHLPQVSCETTLPISSNTFFG